MADPFDYVEARADAVELIADFGGPATLTQTANSGSGYNPTQTTTDYACTAVTIDWKNEEIDGTLIMTTDRKIIISTEGLTVTPAIGDSITIGSDVMRLVEPFKPLSPAGTVVMYETNARA